MAKSCTGWPGCKGIDRDGYLSFTQPVQGLRAMRLILTAYHKKHGIQTIEGICRRWVRKPKTAQQEADMRRYIAAVAYGAGKASTAPLDMLDRKMLARVARGIVFAENSLQPYGEVVLRRAFEY